MAKNGNAAAIMKELLSNLFKYANPILNTVLGFRATGSRLYMWLWTLSNDSAYSSLFVNKTSHHSRAHVTSVYFWQLMWEVVCLWAVLRVQFVNVHTNDTSLTLTYLTIGIFQFRLSVDYGPSEELWMMNWWWAASLHDLSSWGCERASSQPHQ